MFVHTGDYVEHTSDDALRSTYYTFTPLPLQEGNFYTMDDSLAASLSETHRTLGVLKGILHSLPDKEAFMDLMLFREAVSQKWLITPTLISTPCSATVESLTQMTKYKTLNLLIYTLWIQK